MKFLSCKNMKVIVCMLCMLVFASGALWADVYLEFGPKIHASPTRTDELFNLFGFGFTTRIGLLEQELPLKTNTEGLEFLAFYLDFETALLFVPLNRGVEVAAEHVIWLISAGVRFDLMRVRAPGMWFSIYTKEHITLRTGRANESSSVDVGLSVFGGLSFDFDVGVGFFIEAGANPLSFVNPVHSIGTTLGMSVRI